MREGGSSPYYEVTQALFAKMEIPGKSCWCCYFDTEYDRANVPPYNGNDPPPAPGSLKRSLFPTLLNEVQNKGTQGVRARYGAELPPIISIVRYPGRPVISVPDYCKEVGKVLAKQKSTNMRLSDVIRLS